MSCSVHFQRVRSVHCYTVCIKGNKKQIVSRDTISSYHLTPLIVHDPSVYDPFVIEVHLILSVLNAVHLRLPIEIIELLYMSSNLLRYLNDRILSGKQQPSLDREELEVRKCRN